MNDVIITPENNFCLFYSMCIFENSVLKNTVQDKKERKHLVTYFTRKSLNNMFTKN